MITDSDQSVGYIHFYRETQHWFFSRFKDLKKKTGTDVHLKEQP